MSQQNTTPDTPHLYIQAADGEVTIRHGQARPEVVAERVTVNGTITAPADWVTGKIASGYDYFTNDCHAVVNRDAGTITFRSNDEHQTEGGHTVTGRLSEATALQALAINTSRTYTAKKLGQLLKMNRSLFADREENLKIVSDLQRFRATVTQELEKADDTKGNKLYHFEQRVKTEFDLRFTLKTPIYKGQEPVSFRVDIMFDVSDGSVEYWLDSVGLKDLQDIFRDRIIDRELVRLADKNITIIDQ
jgi:hypothetical protein